MCRACRRFAQHIKSATRPGRCEGHASGSGRPATPRPDGHRNATLRYLQIRRLGDDLVPEALLPRSLPNLGKARFRVGRFFV